MTRLFVAAWPPDETCAHLAGLVASAAALAERRVPRENWHVTLRFIGRADPDEVAGRLADATLPSATARLGPTVVELDGRQVVVPVSGVNALAAVVATATRGIGVSTSRPFRGHITLARVKPRPDLTDASESQGRSPLLGEPVSGTFVIGEIALVSSDTRPDGATYTTVATFPTAR